MNGYGIREWNGVIIKPFSNIRLTFILLNEDLDRRSRSFLFVFSYDHTEDSKRRGDKMTPPNFKIARNDNVFIYRSPVSEIYS